MAYAQIYPLECESCPLPSHTRGEYASREVGVGSVWKCDLCERLWKLSDHNSPNSGNSKWVPVER